MKGEGNTLAFNKHRKINGSMISMKEEQNSLKKRNTQKTRMSCNKLKI